MSTINKNQRKRVKTTRETAHPYPVGSTSDFLLDFLTNHHADEYDLLTTEKTGVFVPDFSAESYSLRVTVLNRGVKVVFGPKPDIRLEYGKTETKMEMSPFFSRIDREIAMGESP